MKANMKEYICRQRALFYTHTIPPFWYLHESGNVNEVVHEPQQVLSCGRKERKMWGIDE